MSNFLAALQSIAPINEIPKPSIKLGVPPQSEPVVLDPLQMSVDRVLNRNRIDVTFNRKPEDEILTKLKDFGFKYNAESKAWYHRDCGFTREFLIHVFGVSFDEVLFDDDKPAEEKPVMPQTVESVAGSPEFIRYREQVNQLIERLEIEPADLMLAAIDCLYRKTFEN